MIDRRDAQAALDAWGAGSSQTTAGRFSAALAATERDGGAGGHDIATLIRQVLRSDDESRAARYPDEETLSPARLDVPVTGALPTDFAWADFGLDATETRDGRSVRVTANPWRPPWLGGNWGKTSVDQDVAAERVCGADESVPGDPFLPLIDDEIERYKTPGQKAAVRSAMLLPAGATLLVNLPTGAGKTLAMLAPALRATDGMTSVIVVPTVALAMDHERRHRKQRPNSPPIAYHGGLSDSQKKDFRSRLWSGDQTLLVTNPEALVSSLARPLSDLASGGRLAMLAIDEAHIVASWGDSFRPHFHALAGLRTHLLRKASDAGHGAFKTILASATITEDTILLLRALFGEPGPFFQIAGPVVRPEPCFWSSLELSDEVREERLLEALRFLPRPLIVYATLRNDEKARPGTLTPRRMERLLRRHGFERIAVVDGASSASEREGVVAGLGDEPGKPSRFDVVLANAAFGLGIDIPDIRTVIHACLPESLDRYYQEVGRGGRDGKASISVVLATWADEKVAEGLSSPKQITAARAMARWKAMFGAREELSDDLIRLPLTATPTGVKSHSDLNERWNLFTVSLMARAGALAWDFSLSRPLPEDDAPVDDRGWLTVRVKAPNHMSDEFWTGTAELLRSEMVAKTGNSLTQLRSALGGNSCTGEIVAESYTLKHPEDCRTVCSVACGGCTNCRHVGRPPHSSPAPRPGAIKLAYSDDAIPLRRLATLGSFGPRLIVHTENAVFERSRKLRPVIRGLITSGQIVLVVAPEESMPVLEKALPAPDALDWPLMVETLETLDLLAVPGVPTLIILGPGSDPSRWMQGSAGSPLVVLLGRTDSAGRPGGPSLVEQDGSYSLNDLNGLI